MTSPTPDHSDEPTAGTPFYPEGNPNPARFGFLTFGVFDAPVADFREAVAAIAAALGRPVRYVGTDGYEHGIAGQSYPGWWRRDPPASSASTWEMSAETGRTTHRFRECFNKGSSALRARR